MSDLERDDVFLLDPVQGVLEILERSQMTGTNKLALLLVLLDLAPSHVENDSLISSDVLTDRYIDIHWDHARPYGEVTLRQSSVNKARSEGPPANDTTVMQEIHMLRQQLKEKNHESLQERILDVVKGYVEDEKWFQDSWDRARAKVKRDLWRNPVKRLQTLPGRPRPFLFEIVGDEIQFVPNAAKSLARFSGIIRPLVEFKFVELVAKINKEQLGTTNEDLIHEHLFGKERSMPPDKIRRGLIEVQENRCIFTKRPLNSKAESNSLDHVLPWSRIRLSHIENFVMTTQSVNSSKCDSLIGPDLVKCWLQHLDRHSDDISELAKREGWPTSVDHVHRTALSIYDNVDPATGVWLGKTKGVQPLGIRGKQEIQEMLGDVVQRASGG